MVTHMNPTEQINQRNDQLAQMRVQGLMAECELAARSAAWHVERGVELQDDAGIIQIKEGLLGLVDKHLADARQHMDQYDPTNVRPRVDAERGIKDALDRIKQYAASIDNVSHLRYTDDYEDRDRNTEAVMRLVVQLDSITDAADQAAIAARHPELDERSVRCKAAEKRVRRLLHGQLDEFLDCDVFWSREAQAIHVELSLAWEGHQYTKLHTQLTQVMAEISAESGGLISSGSVLSILPT